MKIDDQNNLDLESEAKYRALVETTGTGYLILDWRGRVVDANQEYVRLSGHKELSEILGRSVIEWTAKYEIERNTKAVAQCIKDGLIRNLEVDYVDREGRITPVEINATVSGKGESLRIISLCRDITERKRAEDELRANEDYLQAIFNSVHVGMALIDAKTHFIVDINPEGCRMFGSSKGEIVGRLCHNFICPAEQGKCPISDLGQTVDNSEKFLVHSDGTRSAILKTVTSIVLNGQDMYLESFVDISGRKRAEELLFTSLKKQEIITDSAMDAIIMMDNAGKISFWNKAAQEIFGYSPEEIIGKDLYLTLVPQRFRKDYLEKYPAFQRTGEGSVIGKRVELVAVRKSGAEFPIELSLAAVIDGGKWTSVGVIRDISERKKAEEERARLQKELEQKIEDLERFQKVTMGRENRVIELKEEIAHLKEQLAGRRS